MIFFPLDINILEILTNSFHTVSKNTKSNLVKNRHTYQYLHNNKFFTKIKKNRNRKVIFQRNKYFKIL